MHLFVSLTAIAQQQQQQNGIQLADPQIGNPPDTGTPPDSGTPPHTLISTKAW